MQPEESKLPPNAYRDSECEPDDEASIVVEDRMPFGNPGPRTNTAPQDDSILNIVNPRVAAKRKMRGSVVDELASEK